MEVLEPQTLRGNVEAFQRDAKSYNLKVRVTWSNSESRSLKERAKGKEQKNGKERKREGEMVERKDFDIHSQCSCDSFLSIPWSVFQHVLMKHTPNRSLLKELTWTHLVVCSLFDQRVKTEHILQQTYGSSYNLKLY